MPLISHAFCLICRTHGFLHVNRNCAKQENLCCVAKKEVHRKGAGAMTEASIEESQDAPGSIYPSNIYPSRIYTIGHSNHPIETFIGLLHQHGIQVLIDTRSSPFSRYAPQFNRDSLKAAVQEADLKYGFFGRHLGGRPEDEDLYDEDGHVLYSEVAKSFLFNDGIERLLGGLSKFRTAILCSEEDPNICHRRLLVSRVLFESGVAVFHIRGNGSVQSEEELRRLEDAAKSSCLDLFETKEAAPWKSIQSVLRKAPPPTFSDD